MATKSVRVKVEAPEEVSDETKALAQRKAHEAAVLVMWDKGEISASRAAEELEVSVHDFLDLLAAEGLPVVRGPLNQEALAEAQRKLKSDAP
jgi:predicted HTH domain antitoxin